MTTTDRKAEHDMTPLYRATIKANGVVVWVVRSESGHDYRVTVFEGKVSGCERSDGEPCKGWRYRRACHHATLVQAREYEREARARAAYDAMFDPHGLAL